MHPACGAAWRQGIWWAHSMGRPYQQEIGMNWKWMMMVGAMGVASMGLAGCGDDEDAPCESDEDCGACEFCDNGTCLGECSQSQECCNDACVPLGQCVHLCIPQMQPCAGSQLDCCVGPMCCDAGETS
jgi:hypothetical protein